MCISEACGWAKMFNVKKHSGIHSTYIKRKKLRVYPYCVQYPNNFDPSLLEDNPSCMEICNPIWLQFEENSNMIKAASAAYVNTANQQCTSSYTVSNHLYTLKLLKWNWIATFNVRVHRIFGRNNSSSCVLNFSSFK